MIKADTRILLEPIPPSKGLTSDEDSGWLGELPLRRTVMWST